MKYTVVCVCVLVDEFVRDVEVLDFEPIVEHVEAANMQEAEFEAAARYKLWVPTKRPRFLAVFEGHLIDLKGQGHEVVCSG